MERPQTREPRGIEAPPAAAVTQDVSSVSNTGMGAFTAPLRQSILSSSQGTLGISPQVETQPTEFLSATDACRAGTVPSSSGNFRGSR